MHGAVQFLSGSDVLLNACNFCEVVAEFTWRDSVQKTLPVQKPDRLLGGDPPERGRKAAPSKGCGEYSDRGSVLLAAGRIGDLGAVAGSAIFGCRLVEEDVLAFDNTNLLVTSFAAHVLVCTFQREGSAQFVIEERGLPLRAVMALCAGCDAILQELLAVRVLVAVFTLGRRTLEVNIHQLGFEVRGLVAIDTGRGAMRSQ